MSELERDGRADAGRSGLCRGRRIDERQINQAVDFVGAHRVLTAALGMAGSEDAAKAALAGLRRAQPNLTLAWLASELPFEHDADKAHYVEGFRRAGLR